MAVYNSTDNYKEDRDKVFFAMPVNIRDNIRMLHFLTFRLDIRK